MERYHSFLKKTISNLDELERRFFFKHWDAMRARLFTVDAPSIFKGSPLALIYCYEEENGTT